MELDPLMQSLMGAFVSEAEEICEQLGASILALEQGEANSEPVVSTYKVLARGLHTLKGSASTIGFRDLADLMHRMEDLIAPGRKASRPVTPRVADALFRALDVFLGEVLVRADSPGRALPDLSDTLTLVDQAAAEERAKDGGTAGAGPADPGEPEPPVGGMSIPNFKEAEAWLAMPGGGAVAVVPAPVEAAPAVVSTPVEVTRSEEDATWRVGTRQVGALMREVERLRELRMRLEERRRELERGLRQLLGLGRRAETAEARNLFARLGRSLSEDSSETVSIVDALEEELRAICTLPARTVLEPLQRSVRDLCRSTGKEARLSVVGGEISLDRRVLESIKGPLVHMVRNAVDHGLEKPAERDRRGKARQGEIVIRIERQGNMLFIEVSDDGGGIDIDRVREEARKRGVVSPEELAAMDVAALQGLIFRPGFSTSKEITETSGRGVGMDVVYTEVQALQGRIEVFSVRGQGTRFVLAIPMELGSSPVLLVRCAEQEFGLPMPAVESVRAMRESELHVGRARMQLEYRGQLLRLQDLGALLGLRQPIVPAAGQPLLIVHSQGLSMALAVDEVAGDAHLVIRPLPLELRGLEAYQGAATLGRGELVPVLRPDWIVDDGRRAEGALSSTRRALVVDDSLTARALHRTILESGGYTVHTASNARQALELLGRAAYDVVICDIGMDEMDGFELTAKIRSRPETSLLPVILVSAHDTESDRQQGMTAGADAFLSKKDCVSGRLLAEVGRIIAGKQGNS